MVACGNSPSNAQGSVVNIDSNAVSTGCLSCEDFPLVVLTRSELLVAQCIACLHLSVYTYKRKQSSELRVSPKEQLVLRLLIDNPKGLYGSDFVAISQGKLGRGSIYTLLDRLVDKGFVRETDDPPSSDGALPRTRHAITGKGQQQYQRLLTDYGLEIREGVFSR
jgi:DNA-binding MarR family transcriptional regulator